MFYYLKPGEKEIKANEKKIAKWLKENFSDVKIWIRRNKFDDIRKEMSRDAAISLAIKKGQTISKLEKL